jgi:hypothetical protein
MKNIIVKKITNGIAILTTSIGIETIISPFKLNITIIVNKRAINVIGEIVGMNFLLNHSSPLDLIKKYLLVTAKAKGSPK